MVEKSQHVCLVCGAPFDMAAMLLDRQLRPSVERYAETGWDLCPEHRRLHEEGFIALVECDPERSGPPGADDMVSPGGLYRTGRLAHLTKEEFVEFIDFGAELNTPCVFVKPGVLEMLGKMLPRSG